MILVARAFGAKGVFVEGGDEDLIKRIERIKEIWGGNYFQVKNVHDGKDIVRAWKGDIIHLTMYGLNLSEHEARLSAIKEPMLIVVGGSKVDGWYYANSTLNLAIGNQPHSEVAALSIFLDRVYKGKQLDLHFVDSKIDVIPTERGKRVVKDDSGK